MAMDKSKLQAYFHTHYLSRQEVLFKLPFSVSIERFWPELMNQRKASGTILSLYDAVGKPYWYVLTDKMVGASEKLCEEAMNQEGDFDPYRAPMTSAMTEEMFFTSFVEGAQIPLQEAMSFLGRGTEPENVQEQMIWNNRQAWSVMMKGLYRPLDESFMKGLAFMLTDEMEGRAEDYRQTDEHEIAAMTNEHYAVPSASVLPERMREYVEFLRKSDVHPLIKAAVGQAYLLVTRPFQEGNERLSRMVSSAVLLRSGYDYFRDISISGMIARESYRYYKAMCEILRSENENDLTYFIEYYIDLLARALEGKKARDKQRDDEQNKEALERERQMAHQPLISTTSASLPQAIEPRNTEATESPPLPALPAKKTSGGIHEILMSHSTRMTDRKTRIEKTLIGFLARGIRSFTREQWQTEAGVAKGTAQDDCWYMLHMTIVVSQRNGINTTYTLTSNAVADSCGTGGHDDYALIRQSLLDLQETGTEREQRIAAQVAEFLEHGIITFSHSEWSAQTGLSRSVNNEDLRTAVNHDLIEQTDNGYRICKRVDLDRRFRTPTPMIRNAVSRLLACYAEQSFTTSDVVNQLSVKANTAAYCLEQLMQKGIITQDRVGQRTYRYAFTKEFLSRRRQNNVITRAETPTTSTNRTGIAAAPRPSSTMQL